MSAPRNLFRNPAEGTTSALLRSPIFTNAPRDPGLLSQIESGQLKTIRCTKFKPDQSYAGSARRYPDGWGPCGERARQKRVYDRAKSRERKREMGGNGRLPNTIRRWFTEGERAVLSVIGAEVKRRGECELAIEKIAALAGVSIRLVQYTLATASWSSPSVMKLPVEDRPPFLMRIERRKRMTNVIKIVSREWINWLDYRPSEAPAAEAAEDGDWKVFDAYAGRILNMLLGKADYGCRKVHTSKKPIFVDVEEAAEVTDGWQRLRLGLPSQGGLGGGASPHRQRERGNE